ncbi:MAG: tetratricopeptide repeat protein [Deltaproteobacteria bacterium]|nr:tetratricopeptide repeat protein [Deltaproteobacteria bacterium]
METHNHTNSFFKIRHDILICLLLAMITLAVYWQVGNHAFVNYDDDKYITANQYVQGGLTLKSVTWAFTSMDVSNWHPLTWLSYLLDIQLFGMNPGMQHLISLFFHVANTLLLFIVLRRMTGALWKSAFVAALFALHPLHVESVAWIAERKDVLSAFFWMLTMGSYAWYVECPGAKRYAPVLLFFVLGLMAKPMLVTLPFVLLLLDYWPLGRLRFRQEGTAADDSPERYGNIHLIWEKIPLLAFAAASSVLTFFAQQSGGAVRSFDAVPLAARISNGLVSYASYIGKMIWPFDLAVLYPYSNNLPVWQVAGAGLLLILLSFMVIRFMRRFPYLIVGWLWYLGTLVPVIGLVQVGAQSMADRYTYIPLIGLFVMIAWGLPDLVARWHHRRIFLAVSVGCILSALITVTWLQLQYWQNSISLFEHTLNVTADNYVMHSNMGAALAELGRTDEAIAHYREALRIKPDDAEARYNMANALERQGNLKDAIAEYGEVLKTRPDMASAHNNMGITLSRLGETKEAIVHFREALRIKPGYRDAESNLEIALKRDEAIEKAAALRPLEQRTDTGDAEAQMRLGLELLQRGKFDEAVDRFREALKINPKLVEAHVNLGLAFAYNREIDKAVEHFRKALAINPRLAEVHNSLGVALAQKGELDEAIGHFEEALRIKPEFAKAHNSLGVVMARKGRIKDAVAHFREALRIEPGHKDAGKNLKIMLDMQGKSQ